MSLIGSVAGTGGSGLTWAQIMGFEPGTTYDPAAAWQAAVTAASGQAAAPQQQAGGYGNGASYVSREASSLAPGAEWVGRVAPNTVLAQSTLREQEAVRQQEAAWAAQQKLDDYLKADAAQMTKAQGEQDRLNEYLRADAAQMSSAAASVPGYRVQPHQTETTSVPASPPSGDTWDGSYTDIPTHPYARWDDGRFQKNADGMFVLEGPNDARYLTSMSPGAYADYAKQMGGSVPTLDQLGRGPVVPGADQMFQDNRPTFDEQTGQTTKWGMERRDQILRAPTGVFDPNLGFARPTNPTPPSSPAPLLPFDIPVIGGGVGFGAGSQVGPYFGTTAPGPASNNIEAKADSSIATQINGQPYPSADNPNVSLDAAKANPLPTGASTTIPPSHKLGMGTKIDLTNGAALPTLSAAGAAGAVGAAAGTPTPPATTAAPAAPSPTSGTGTPSAGTGGVTAPAPSGGPPVTGGAGVPPAPAGVDPTMWAAIIAGLGGAVSGGMALWGANNVAASEEKAAQIQATAAENAAKLQDEQHKASLAELTRQFNVGQANLAPWMTAGTAALDQLKTFDTNNPHTNVPEFGMDQFKVDPGYNFRLSEGLKALQNSAAARGQLVSGNSMKALQDYGQQSASQEYGAAFNRYNTQKNDQFNRYQTNMGTRLGSLQSLAGVGQSAVQQAGQAGQNYANNIGQAGQNYANSVGQLGMGAAQARAGGVTGAAAANASGYMGAGNALTNAINQGYSAWQGNQMIALLRNR